ncbi:MAG: aldo/keto reductase, partial [Nisaea sp.]|uniref:aldo/keto reductase n=1 Tax=Nisaea sp. TaxID=2024842 RepID=UPI001B21480F
LGRTGMTVSAVSLGTMTFGTQNTQEDGFAQMDRALDAGINFFDTAEMYAVPPTEQSYGKTEEIIGNWFIRSGKRDKVILATKVVGPATDRKYIRGGANRLTRESINQALDASLKRLRTDYVDYYQVHWPDRPTNTFGRLGYQHQPDAESVPIEETLGALADLVKSGKVRAIGLSN